MVDALDAVSGFYGPDGNTVESRRTLRADLERQSALLLGSVLNAFVVSGFLQKFQLSEEQLHALQEAPLEDDEGASFFSALDHGHAIRESCKSLLTSAHQSAGSELRNAMADHQESAYARLYQWVQDHCQDREGDSLSTEEKIQGEKTSFSPHD
jgi:hypothetical protein